MADSRQSFEAKSQAAFLADDQSTHQPFISNSVGLTILQLETIYYKTDGPGKEIIEHEYAEWKKEIRLVAKASENPNWINAVEAMIQKADEPITRENRAWNMVTLYLPTI